MEVRFCWVDVFADLPLTGNPLALVPEADDLTEEQLAAIAREFNQSETTFLVRPSREGADHRLRSFTPGGVEVFGAGHNAMGAWIWLADSGSLAPEQDTFVQQIGDDLLGVRLDRTVEMAQVSMQQSSPRFLRRVDRSAALASALGLALDDLSPDRAAEVVSTGAEHLLVPSVSMAAVDAAEPDSAGLRTFLATAGAEGCYLYTLDTEAAGPGIDAYARFFNPTVGIAEDPATGTAAGPLAAVLARDGITRQRSPITIEQGRRLGRPSRLTVVVDGESVTISGSGIVVAEGVLHL
jgi:trans-2,3-dihydro-3-hydroxyanthranilate isomerase